MLSESSQLLITRMYNLQSSNSCKFQIETVLWTTMTLWAGTYEQE